MDLRQHYKRVREALASLDEKAEVFFLKSKETETGAKAGVVVEVNRETAAKFIGEGTHDLATEADVEKFKADQEAAKQAIIDAEFEKKQTVNLKVMPSGRAEVERKAPATKQ